MCISVSIVFNTDLSTLCGGNVVGALDSDDEPENVAKLIGPEPLQIGIVLYMLGLSNRNIECSSYTYILRSQSGDSLASTV